QELSITPSAVSHRINLLEKELGFLLFQRFHRRITLTPEGERMQWALDSSFNTLNQEILDIKNRELTGTLTLYSHPSLVQCLLLPRIGDFIAQHPTIHLNILTGQEIINLANRGVDLAMYFGKLPSGRHLDEA
ncbi:LysR family transcriptional regulator, partial [Escherichia coli]|uniref:LysR family transcriptional regulator n=5 Tax=Enterobacterales TaxID=91347 RepID=UPI0022840048